MEDPNQTSRRDFLKTAVVGGLALGAADALSVAARAEPARSTVAVAKDAALRTPDGAPDPVRMAALLDKVMQAYFGVSDPVEPWKGLVQPGQVVGLKVNTIGGAPLSTDVSLVKAIVARLQQAGVKPGDIVIWDRYARELEKAGFPLTSEAGKVRCMATDAVGFEDAPETHGAVSCKLSKILTQVCDTVINLPLIKDHGLSGVTLAMKNMYGVIHNPQDYHSTNCNPYIADVNMLPTIKKKVRFHIVDATNGCYEGGPVRFKFPWKPDTLMVGHDAVALDTIGWQMIEKKRAEQGLPTLEAAGRPPHYIATAADAEHGLGTNQPNLISVVEV